MFSNRLFDAKRHRRENSTLFIDTLKPISDIFYLLQTIAPGMLLIIREDEYDDMGEHETARALPSGTWVEEHQSILENILGRDRYNLLVGAAADGNKSFRGRWISRYDSYDDDSDDGYYTNAWGVREPMDFTACDSECGYCGRCEY